MREEDPQYPDISAFIPRLTILLRCGLLIFHASIHVGCSKSSGLPLDSAKVVEVLNTWQLIPDLRVLLRMYTEVY